MNKDRAAFFDRGAMSDTNKNKARNQLNQLTS